MLKFLEQRAAKLQHDMQALCVDGELSAENRAKFDQMESALHEVEAAIGEAKDAEMNELRSRLESFERKADPAREDEGSVSFRSYLRAGIEGVENRASLKSGTDANGGFIVPENMHAQLIEPVRAVNPIVRLATQFTLGGSASIELPRKATHGAVASAAEDAARTEQAAPTFANDTLTAYELYTDQRATQQFLDEVDGSESMIMNWIYGDIFEQHEKNCADGDGSNKATGLFTASEFYKKANVAAAGKVTASDVMNMYFKLPAAFRVNGTWLANSNTLAQLAQLSHPAASGSIPFVTFVDGKPYILGKAVEECDNAPEIGTATFPLAFGDISKAYAVAIHRNVTVLRDPYTATPKVRFYGIARLGGRPWNPEAAVLLNTAIA